MFLHSLTVSQFRNWDYREFELSPTMNYFVGPNGSGKTSVLEAIQFLSTGRSFRSNRDQDCVQWGTGSFSIRGGFRDEPLDSISISYRQRGGRPRKLAKVDGDALSRLSELRGRFPVVLFAPDHLQILKQGPERRRQWLDGMLSMLEPQYMDTLRSYDEARQQRNELLKKPSYDNVLMESYEETMARTGREITRSRKRLLERLQSPLKERLHTIAGERFSELDLEYRPDVSSDTDMEELFQQERSSAQRRGYTTRGPQRDDWMVLREGRPVDRFASQGELRILLVSLKLSEAWIIIKELDREPSVLLDDLESELDETHCRRCLRQVRELPYQVLVTGTHPPSSDAPVDPQQIITLQTRD